MGRVFFIGLSPWKCLIQLHTPFFWKPASLVAPVTAHALNFLLPHALPLSVLCWLLAPSSLSVLDCPSTCFWALSAFLHDLDTLLHSWLYPIHMLVSLSCISSTGSFSELYTCVTNVTYLNMSRLHFPLNNHITISHNLLAVAM